MDRLTSVTRPTLTVYQAQNTTGPAPAVLICPGGAYKILATNIEGSEVAEWLNSIGLTAAVLKYRVPDNRPAALQDAQRAMAILRQRGTEWNIDPKRLGVMGFSAGGHLSARLCSTGGERMYQPIDEADQVSCRPDFCILVYPAYLADKDMRLTEGIQVSSLTPPTFLVQTEDDKNYVWSGIAYTAALVKAGIPCEYHLFPKGGHGYGLRKSAKSVSGWQNLCSRWMRTAGIL